MLGAARLAALCADCTCLTISARTHMHYRHRYERGVQRSMLAQTLSPLVRLACLHRVRPCRQPCGAALLAEAGVCVLARRRLGISQPPIHGGMIEWHMPVDSAAFAGAVEDEEHALFACIAYGTNFNGSSWP